MSGDEVGGPSKGRASRFSKAGLKFPVDRISRRLRKKAHPSGVSAEAAVYLAAVMEYMTAELLSLFDKDVKEISEYMLKSVIRNDEEFNRLLGGVCIVGTGELSEIEAILSAFKKDKEPK